MRLQSAAESTTSVKVSLSRACLANGEMHEGVELKVPRHARANGSFRLLRMALPWPRLRRSYSSIQQANILEVVVPEQMQREVCQLGWQRLGLTAALSEEGICPPAKTNHFAVKILRIS